MPGPVSDSLPIINAFKEGWQSALREDGFKYFVLKCEDFLNALTSKEARAFDRMLQKHESYRVKKGKSSSNRYWVVNRDEPYADEVKRLIEKNRGIVL